MYPFGYGLFYLALMHLRFIDIIACISSYFLFILNGILFYWRYLPQFVYHFPLKGYLGSLWFLAI